MNRQLVAFSGREAVMPKPTSPQNEPGYYPVLLNWGQYAVDFKRMEDAAASQGVSLLTLGLGLVVS